jgi:hypothetical protein
MIKDGVPDKVEQAKSFILAELEMGPRRSTDLLAAARLHRLSERTLKRAKRELLLHRWHIKRGARFEWWWALRAHRGARISVVLDAQNWVIDVVEGIATCG